MNFMYVWCNFLCAPVKSFCRTLNNFLVFHLFWFIFLAAVKNILLLKISTLFRLKYPWIRLCSHSHWKHWWGIHENRKKSHILLNLVYVRTNILTSLYEMFLLFLLKMTVNFRFCYRQLILGTLLSWRNK